MHLPLTRPLHFGGENVVGRKETVSAEEFVFTNKGSQDQICIIATVWVNRVK